MGQVKMRNIKLTIQYDGTRYAGWQSQKNALSIQDIIQGRIRKIVGLKCCLIASGRTDTGVHAMAQAANFRTRSRIPLKKLQMALNSALPRDITISYIEEAPLSFNAQHDARGKVYRYTIVNNDFTNPFLRNFAARCFHRLDLRLMRKAAAILKGRHDFKPFQASGAGRGNTVRTLRRLIIKKDRDVLYLDMEADGFLYNMARTIAGTLVEAGRGKMPLAQIKDILRTKDRRLCGPTMPAKGLCLMKVIYR
jgi:tRNA pseudouridine38-40 synthase